MKQLAFDFSGREKPATTRVIGEHSSTVSEGVHSTVVDIIEPTKMKYNYLESVRIGNRKYEFRISNQIKEGTYEKDPKTGKIRSIVFLMKEGDTSYKFKIGINTYGITTSHTDDGVIRGVTHMDLSYIQRLDSNLGGPQYSAKHDRNIRSFNYFQRVFGLNNANDPLIALLHRVIIDIGTREENREGK